ncbi:type II toxin-antitoxin system toxin ribonuclease C26 [soil metagenome]
MILDTSGLFAFFDTSDRHHNEVAEVMAQRDGPFTISPFVIAELDYLVATRLGTEEQLAMLREIGSGAYDHAPLDEGQFSRAVAVVERYRDLDIGITDASLVVLAGSHPTNEVLTIDERHFRALRTEGGEPFRLLPADRSG